MRKKIGSLKHIIINISVLSVMLPNIAIAITVRRMSHDLGVVTIFRFSEWLFLDSQNSDYG